LEAGFFAPECVLVAVVLLWALLELLDALLPPHPAITTATAAAASRLRATTISVRLTGWTPNIAQTPRARP
jgi:hypothetical protein